MKLNVFLAVALHIAGGLSTAIPDLNKRGADSADTPMNSLEMTRRELIAPVDGGMLDGLFEDLCIFGKSLGCSDGYCWRTCDKLKWCWTAEDLGTGDWLSCSSDSDCFEADSCGEGDCDDCGCGC